MTVWPFWCCGLFTSCCCEYVGDRSAHGGDRCGLGDPAVSGGDFPDVLYLCCAQAVFVLVENERCPVAAYLGVESGSEDWLGHDGVEDRPGHNEDEANHDGDNEQYGAVGEGEE